MAIVYAHLPRDGAVPACGACRYLWTNFTASRRECWCVLAARLAGIFPLPDGKRPAGVGRLSASTPSCKYFEAKP